MLFFVWLFSASSFPSHLNFLSLLYYGWQEDIDDNDLGVLFKNKKRAARALLHTARGSACWLLSVPLIYNLHHRDLPFSIGLDLDPPDVVNKTAAARHLSLLLRITIMMVVKYQKHFAFLTVLPAAPHARTFPLHLSPGQEGRQEGRYA